MIIKPKTTPAVHRGNYYDLKAPKFSLRRALMVLDVFNLTIEEQYLVDGGKTMILAVGHIDLSKRLRVVAKLQKRAVPKSEWKYVKDTMLLEGNIEGNIVSFLVFERRELKEKA